MLTATQRLLLATTQRNKFRVSRSARRVLLTTACAVAFLLGLHIPVEWWITG